MQFLLRLRNHICLKRWSGVTKLGQHKRIRLNRTYNFFDSKVVDLIWSVRELYADGRRSHPTVLTERVSRESLQRTIRRIERDELPARLEAFAQKIGETL